MPPSRTFASNFFLPRLKVTSHVLVATRAGFPPTLAQSTAAPTPLSCCSPAQLPLPLAPRRYSRRRGRASPWPRAAIAPATRGARKPVAAASSREWAPFVKEEFGARLRKKLPGFSSFLRIQFKVKETNPSVLCRNRIARRLSLRQRSSHSSPHRTSSTPTLPYAAPHRRCQLLLPRRWRLSPRRPVSAATRICSSACPSCPTRVWRQRG